MIDLNTDAVLFHFDVVNDSIEALEFSVDDRSLITVDRQGGVSAWSLDSGEELYRTYPEGEGVWMNSVNVASNGAWMVVGTDNYKVRVLDIDTGENVTVFQNPDIVTWCVDCAHSTFVIAAVFSQNNGTVYSAGWDAVVHAWDLYSGDLLKTYSGHSGEVTDLALSAEDQLMVTSGFDGTVRVWDVANGTEIAVLRGHSGAVNQVAISDSGEYIVTAGQDGTVRLFYDRYRNETLRFPVGEQNYTSYVLADFDASGEYIVYSGWGDPIQLLDTNTAETVAVLEGDIEGVLKVDFSADGRYMVGGTNFNRVYVWDMSDYSLIEELRPLPEDPPAELLIYGVAISPDGRYVVMSEGRSGLFRVWDMLDRKFVFETVLAAELSYDCPDCITQVFDFEFSPDGAYLVVSRADANVQVWQVEGWIRTETNVNFGDTFGYANGVLDSAFSINGSMVASASSAASLKVWDFATGDVRFELEGHVDAVQTVDFTSAGVMIITASDDDTVRFWDADTGKYMFKYDYGGQDLKGAQISPDGQHLMVITQFPVQIYVYDFRLSTLFPLVEQAIGDGALSANDCSLYIQSTDCELDWTLFKLAIGILE